MKEIKKPETAETKVNAVPITALLSCVSDDLETAVAVVQKRYNLPFGLVDLAIAPVLVKIKERAMFEMADAHITEPGRKDAAPAGDENEGKKQQERDADG